MKVVKATDRLYEENSYMLIDKKEVTLIDPGFSYDLISLYMKERNLSLKMILLTHGHIDHINDIDKFDKEFKGVPIYIHEKDSNMLFDDNLNCSRMFGDPKKFSTSLNVKIVEDGYEVDGFKFIHTPGHTKGSCVIKYSNFLFTGDTLFYRSVGRTDLPSGNIKDLNESLEKIKKSFSKSIIIYPGHYSATVLKDEILNNPYMRK